MSQSTTVKTTSINDFLTVSATPGRGPVAAMSRQVSVWYGRHVGRKQLRSVQPRLLDDMGISPLDAMIEARKPFWVE